MADLYRKSALEKLSSPEQLDREIVIVSPSFWLAVLGATLIIISALVWSIFGKLPLYVSANGIYMNRGGIHSVYSDQPGMVDEILVETGEEVKKDQVIVVLSSREAKHTLEELEKRRTFVEEVTLNSLNDVATDDNKALLYLKSQNLTQDSNDLALSGNETEASALAMQFDAEKNAALALIDRQIADCREQISRNEIRSSLDGIVTELAVADGQVIAAGDYVARVSRGDQTDNVVVCYVPVTEGRRIKVGMKASVYPSTANKQEYGHMRGSVEYVDEYVTSRAEIRNQVAVTSLVDTFIQDGPVIEVRLNLEKDETTESGYWWSSKKGRSMDLVNGTMVAADISIEEKAPITMLLPYIREKLTVEKPAPENAGNE